MAQEMAKKLSVIIFSRNDTKNLLELIYNVYNIADQVVIIDSSEKTEREKIIRVIKKLEKTEFFWVVALGYPDPLRMYGLSKCKNDWVLYLDTDERISDALRQDVNKIIQTNNACAFAIKRFENRNTKKPNTFFTWQIRLYRKGCVRYKGIIHEQPIINGDIKRLDDKYYINHGKNVIGRDYWKMEKFERYSYESFNDVVIDYASKLNACTKDAFVKTQKGKFILLTLALYEKLGLKKKECEISNFDYLLLYSMRDFAYKFKSGDFRGILTTAVEKARWLKKFKKWKNSSEGKISFNIAIDIWKYGIISYLRLDDEKIVLKLNKKYANRKQGVDLLIKLIKDKYYGRYP